LRVRAPGFQQHRQIRSHRNSACPDIPQHTYW
jgi:hypothetical protein